MSLNFTPIAHPYQPGVEDKREGFIVLQLSDIQVWGIKEDTDKSAVHNKQKTYYNILHHIHKSRSHVLGWQFG